MMVGRGGSLFGRQAICLRWFIQGDPNVNRTDEWPFVRTLLTYDEVDSTSDRAADLIREGTIELPMAVWARSQTRGRGRGGHSWWSDPGSLTFTLGIDPAFHGLTVASEPKLALATAVAVIDALEVVGLGGGALGIRWPNDLEASGRKLGGILPERIETGRGHRILIGVGLNVLTDLGDAPAEIRRMAASLAGIHAGTLGEGVLPCVLGAILEQFDRVLGRLIAGDRELASRWNELDVLRGHWVRVDLGTRVVAGRGSGIDPDGALCLDDGVERRRLFGGQVLRP
jgi:BirA family transcriptional regulator, biotin operon repressor / biotin---[acetyl-CoA-carboxylase] ligase